MGLGFLESPEIVPNRPRPMGFVSRVTVSVCHSERALLLKLIFPMYPTIAKMSHFDDEKFKQLQLKVKFNVIPKTRLKKFGKLFDGYPTGLVKSEPGGFVMPPTYGENAEKIYRMKPRTDDVWLLTFPKCGTTWTSELLWLLKNDCNFETAAKIQLHSRAPFLEMPYLSAVSGPMKNFLMTVDKVEKLPSPRVIRPHLPFYLLPPELLDTTKVVYVARNPKDVIVSYYFHHKLIKVHGYTGTLDEFAEFFINDEVVYAPFFPHILDAWSKRHHPNMHFMFYEDMKKDLRGEIEKVATFLGKSYSDEQLGKLTEHLKFENFQKNESVNSESGKKFGAMNEDGRFIRNGKTGDWKNHFSPELNSRIDEWIEKNLAGTDLKFVTELEHQD
ncbi:sulfotransferase 1B1-like isoform X1 [Daphnia pulex]|uniref:sulfotransferase 1B1-like isoform X1 n=1 Tax=Daphnia pulex TaxID=6669 RepID=UPI001EDEB022|nr:sulfotransferase 1B1-like isoform X1 [Daphnia pulex]